MFYQSKFQKHQAFEAEVSANQERVLETINLAEGESQFNSDQHLVSPGNFDTLLNR